MFLLGVARPKKIFGGALTVALLPMGGNRT